MRPTYDYISQVGYHNNLYYINLKPNFLYKHKYNTTKTQIYFETLFYQFIDLAQLQNSIEIEHDSVHFVLKKLPQSLLKDTIDKKWWIWMENLKEQLFPISLIFIPPWME